MKNRYLATGAVIATEVLAGCGGHTEHKPATAAIKTKIGQIVTANENNPQTSYPGVEPTKLRSLRNFTVKAAGIRREITAVYEHADAGVADKEARLYALSQQIMMNMAQDYQTLTLPLTDQQKNKSVTIGTRLNVIRKPSVFAVTGSQDFYGYINRQFPTIARALTIQNDPSSIITFNGVTEPYSKNSNMIGAATEGCQSSIYVGTRNPSLQIPAQEAICNSWGAALNEAQSGADYASYMRYTLRLSQHSTSYNGYNFREFVVPQAAYKALANGKAPSEEAMSCLYTAGATQPPANC